MLHATGVLAFLDVAHVQHNSNPRIYQRLPTIVDRHTPKGPQQQQQGVAQACMQIQRPDDAGARLSDVLVTASCNGIALAARMAA